MTPASHVHTLSCTEPNCRLPVGRVIGDYVEILGKHHGEKHYAKIPLADLLKFIGVNLDAKLLDKQSITS